MNLTHGDQVLFRETGLLHLKRFVPSKSLTRVKRAIDSELKRLKLTGKSALTSSKLHALPFFQQIGAVSQRVKLGPELDRIFSDELIQIMTELAGSRLQPSAPHPQLLLSLPQKTVWALTGLNWHLDLAVPKVDEIPGVQAFILLDEVKPKGGATLALAGSHRLHYVDTSHKTNAHGALRRHDVFSALFQHDEFPAAELLKSRFVNGIEISVKEMSGDAGDVYLMDLRVLHSPSINSSKNVRMMATNRFMTRAARGAMRIR